MPFLHLEVEKERRAFVLSEDYSIERLIGKTPIGNRGADTGKLPIEFPINLICGVQGKRANVILVLYLSQQRQRP